MKVANGVEMLEIPAVLAGIPGAVGESLIHPTLLWDQDTVILVDAGLPGQESVIREAAEKAGVPFSRLSKVIITHHDMDHLGGLAGLLKEAPQKIEVLAHEEEKPYLHCEKPPLRLTQIEARLNSLSDEKRPVITALYENLKANYKKFQVTVDKTVADGEELPFCGGITVIYTPGHTPGHICLYLRQSKTLIAGDAMNVQDGTLVAAPEFTIVDKEAAKSSLERLTLFDIENVICYHGGLFRDKPVRRIGELAKG